MTKKKIKAEVRIVMLKLVYRSVILKKEEQNRILLQLFTF